MFDLIVDPNESESTHGDATYDDVKLYMESRIPSFWVSAMREPDMSDNPGETVIKQQWDNCHTTCPWTLNTAQYDIEHKYAYPKAPHIVFILVDDWGYNDVGYRSTSMTWTTPTIDKLASEGVILNNYFTHESCAPSRGALMTGRLAIRLGLQGAADDFGPELPLAEVTLAQELKSAGYKTYLIGKWHLGMSSASRTPTYRGFDYFYGYYNSYIDYWTKTFQVSSVTLSTNQQTISTCCIDISYQYILSIHPIDASTNSTFNASCRNSYCFDCWPTNNTIRDTMTCTKASSQ